VHDDGISGSRLRSSVSDKPIGAVVSVVWYSAAAAAGIGEALESGADLLLVDVVRIARAAMPCEHLFQAASLARQCGLLS